MEGWLGAELTGTVKDLAKKKVPKGSKKKNVSDRRGAHGRKNIKKESKKNHHDTSFCTFLLQLGRSHEMVKT